MDRETTRRGLLGATVGGGLLAAFSPAVRPYLDALAPLSGRVWGAFDRSVSGSVTNPYGEATLRYDDDGVAHVTADDERSLYFAVGFAHASDRLFQMDLQRRQMRGELSAAFGEDTVESDVFYTKLDAVTAAEVTWEAIDGDDPAPLFEAYTEGVNRYVTDEPLPVEFRLLDYEPNEWSPVDSLLAQKQIAWGLTGRFNTLRRESVANALEPDLARTLYPARMDHDSPIVRSDGTDTTTPDVDDGLGEAGISPAIADRYAGFEAPDGVGSNSWVVGGEHTDDGSPIVANDPHLGLRVPPTWYEQHLQTDATSVRGVTFPGVPPVVIGENDAGAWGFTNAGVDCIDFYRYDTRDDEYRYGDDWLRFDREERTIEVSDGDDRTVTVERTVHGPVIDAESDGDDLANRVAVAWTGLTATETSSAVVELNRSTGVEDAREAMAKFDEPTQNFVYADRTGNTYYFVTGRIPQRYTDGDAVGGRRVFDGSEGEGEWRGFTPYGESSWEGFVPHDEKPELVNPEYVATANQRIVDDPGRYLAEGYASPFRGERIYERLDDRVASDDPVTPEFVVDVQTDTVDGRARRFVPDLLDAVDGDDDLGDAVDSLSGWDYRMDVDSRAALLFDRALAAFRDRAVESVLTDALGDRRDVTDYYPNDWVFLTLRGDPWFPDGRDHALRNALRDAVSEIDDASWETYGDLNQAVLDHPFELSWLNYPRGPTDGSPATVNNFRRPEDGDIGSSWRMICPLGDAESRAILPGGNSGDPTSDHYHDQLADWRENEYKPMDRTVRGDVAVRFGEDDG